MAKMKTAEQPDEKISAAIDAAEVCLTGWENMTDPETGKSIPFGRETIGDVLNIDELGEVFEAVTSAAAASVDVKKKSE
ncbi:MAG TPA: hypothetical protein VMX74_02740 [Pirellulales bacterium]|nr:hypothetical protein [Pirellulales bacterium]